MIMKDFEDKYKEHFWVPFLIPITILIRNIVETAKANNKYSTVWIIMFSIQLFAVLVMMLLMFLWGRSRITDRHVRVGRSIAAIVIVLSTIVTLSAIAWFIK